MSDQERLEVSVHEDTGTVHVSINATGEMTFVRSTAVLDPASARHAAAAILLAADTVESAPARELAAGKNPFGDIRQAIAKKRSAREEPGEGGSDAEGRKLYLIEVPAVVFDALFEHVELSVANETHRDQGYIIYLGTRIRRTPSE